MRARRGRSEWRSRPSPDGRPVADAADGRHVPRIVGVVAELVAQPSDVDVDRPVEDLRPVPAVYLVAVEVDGQVGKGEWRTAAGVGRRGRGPAQDRLDAKDELGRRERLWQVVVGAVLEAGDAVERRATGRHDQDRRSGRLVVAAYGPDDGPAVQPGEHEVEDDERRPVAFDGVERAWAIRR